LAALLDARPITDDSRHDLQLVFDEVVINIMRYGGARSDVNVRIAFGDGEVILAFEDDGRPFDPCVHPEPPQPTCLDETPTGGRGIMLVRQLSSRMEYQRTSAKRNLLTVAVPVR
jgi:serine/threonine-protein kinase RsbW